MGEKREKKMTKLVIYLKNQKNNIISAFLIAVILLGTVPITDIEILGVVPTFYRVCIPLLAVYFLYRHVTAQRSVWKNKIKLYKIFVLFVAFWIAYGIVQILVCSYVDLKLGLQELVSILLGAISALCIIECIFVYEGLTVIINSARAVVIAVTIVGIFEMATCNHFKTSMLCSDIYLNAYFDSYGFIPADGKVSAMATAIFYNVNDFSAWLGVFSALFYPRREQNVLTKILFICELSVMALFALVNDAWICLIAMCIGGIVYLVFVRARVITCFTVFLWGAALKLFVVQAFIHTIEFIYITFFPNKRIPQPIAILIQDGTSQISEAVEGQIVGMETGRGSLSLRFNTYGTAIKETVSSSFGLGFGPGSFSNYFAGLNSSSVLINPHSFWIEILFQYGAVILICFLAILVYMFIRLFRIWRKVPCGIVAQILAMDVILVLISFAPSSFLGYAYWWIPIGVTLGIVVKEEAEYR